MYGRQTTHAFAIVSRLAEVFDEGAKLSANSIADSRGIAQPSVAKVLSVLSTAGLVMGKSGPGGGFTLARHPSEIRLFDVFSIFERDADELTMKVCPFGGGICGGADPCPLHSRLEAVQESVNQLLLDTTFDVFRCPDVATDQSD